MRPLWPSNVLCQTACPRVVDFTNRVGRGHVCTDGRGQAQTERGRLVALDQDGCVVLEVNGKHLPVPNARVDALVEGE
jgi:hypothetical protein